MLLKRRQNVKMAAQKIKKLPEILVIGAKKCGTDALTVFMDLHSKITRNGKEINFFNDNYSKGTSWYLKKLVKVRRDNLLVEKTPGYMTGSNVPSRIWKMNPNMKILLIVRDPVNRLISDHAHILAHGKTNITSFKKFVFTDGKMKINTQLPQLKTGMYVIYLERYLKYFRREQIHVVDGDNIIRRPWEELEKVQSFLGLKKEITKNNFQYNKKKRFFCFRKNVEDNRKFKCMIKSKGRPHPVISNETKEILAKFYHPFDIQLQKVANQTFLWINKT